MPGYSLHETGTCRMGNDPKKFVANCFGQTDDVAGMVESSRGVMKHLSGKSGLAAFGAIFHWRGRYVLAEGGRLGNENGFTLELIVLRITALSQRFVPPKN